MEITAVIIFEAETGITLFSCFCNEDRGILLSSFLSAVAQLAEELELGQHLNFVAEERSVVLVRDQDIIVAMIANGFEDSHEMQAVARKIGREFNKRYQAAMSNGSGVVENAKFQDFKRVLKQIVYNERESFASFSGLINFIQRQFCDDILIHPRIMGRDGKMHVIDMIVDCGSKHGSMHDKLAMKLFKALSREVIFIKIFEGQADEIGVITFLEFLKLFGAKDEELKQNPSLYPYFPSRAVIIAEKFPPNILESLSAIFPKEDSGFYVGATHLAPTAELKFTPHVAHCHVELWQWESGRAKRIA